MHLPGFCASSRSKFVPGLPLPALLCKARAGMKAYCSSCPLPSDWLWQPHILQVLGFLFGFPLLSTGAGLAIALAQEAELMSLLSLCLCLGPEHFVDVLLP